MKMKTFLLTAVFAVFALALAACTPLVTSPPGVGQTAAQISATQTANMQANWYIYCEAFKAAQPTIAMKIPTAPLSAVKIVAPLTRKIADECSKPMPTDLNAAVTQLTQDVTTVIMQLGIQAALPPSPVPGTKT